MKTKLMIIAAAVFVIAAAAGTYTGLRSGIALSKSDKFSTLLAAMDARSATREFSDRSIDEFTTGKILWAAFGKNSHGTRTIPTAKNQQNLKVYAIRADGAFLYDGEKLNKISDKDLRPLFAQQDFVKTAPLTLLFVGSDKDYSAMHAGSSYQNVALYCTERGIGNVVRAYFDKQAVAKELNLSAGEFAIISQTIGHKK